MVIGDTVTAKTAVIGEIATILAAPEDVIIEVANPTICTHMTPKDVVNFPNRKIKRSVYSQIIKLFDLQQEDGGILGIKDDVISSFCFEKGVSQKNYQINVNKFAEEVEKWDEQGITFVGFIHSHITNDKEPSLTDLIYVRKFISANQDIKQVDFPVVYSDNGKLAIQYYIFKQNQFFPVDILLVD